MCGECKYILRIRFCVRQPARGSGTTVCKSFQHLDIRGNRQTIVNTYVPPAVRKHVGIALLVLLMHGGAAEGHRSNRHVLIQYYSVV